jgi:hypothetical protein
MGIVARSVPPVQPGGDCVAFDAGARKADAGAGRCSTVGPARASRASAAAASGAGG